MIQSQNFVKHSFLLSGGNWILVDAATQQQVAEHVCENVLPFLETLQDMCDDYGVCQIFPIVLFVLLHHPANQTVFLKTYKLFY